MTPAQWDALRDWIRAEIRVARSEHSADPKRREQMEEIRGHAEEAAHEALVIRHDV